MPAAHVSCKYLTSTIKRAHGTFVCIMSGLGNRLQDYDLHSQWKTDGIDCLPTCLWRVSIGNATALAGEILKALIPLGDGRVFVFTTIYAVAVGYAMHKILRVSYTARQCRSLRRKVVPAFPQFRIFYYTPLYRRLGSSVYQKQFSLVLGQRPRQRIRYFFADVRTEQIIHAHSEILSYYPHADKKPDL